MIEGLLVKLSRANMLVLLVSSCKPLRYSISTGKISAEVTMVDEYSCITALPFSLLCMFDITYIKTCLFLFDVFSNDGKMPHALTVVLIL